MGPGRSVGTRIRDDPDMTHPTRPDVRRRRYHGGHVLIADELVRADLVVDDDVIAEIITDTGSDESIDDDRSGDVDCRDRVIAPGFIDLQCNGAHGVDITTEPHRILEVAAELPRFGVTS